MDPPVIRSAVADDAGSIAALLRSLGYPAAGQGTRERLLTATEQTRSLVLVAERNSEVIGCLSAVLLPYFPDGSTLCRITTLVVAASYQRHQVGTALLNAAAHFAASNGCSGIEVTTKETRRQAHAFYERSGFVRTSLRYFRKL